MECVEIRRIFDAVFHALGPKRLIGRFYRTIYHESEVVKALVRLEYYLTFNI